MYVERGTPADAYEVDMGVRGTEVQIVCEGSYFDIVRACAIRADGKAKPQLNTSRKIWRFTRCISSWVRSSLAHTLFPTVEPLGKELLQERCRRVSSSLRCH